MSIGVLTVDDRDLMRETVRSFLESLPGVEVVGEAENGREECWSQRAMNSLFLKQASNEDTATCWSQGISRTVLSGQWQQDFPSAASKLPE